MSIVAVDPRVRQEFIPESEKKKKKDVTKFFYLPMSETEKVSMAQMLPGGKGAMPESFLVELVIDHLAGWENLLDKNGKQIEFNQENIDRVPWLVLLEVGAHILNSSGFGSVERKN